MRPGGDATRSGRRVVLLSMLIGVAGGCATTRGRSDVEPLDRAAIARCQVTPSRVPIGAASVEALAGRYRLYMDSDAEPGEPVSGLLELAVPGAGPTGAAPSGAPAVPSLVGASDIVAAEVGAVVPGELASIDESAPGVGAYVFAPDPERPTDMMAVLRMGTDSNRRDRQRFDGAHTTLRITSIAADWFGGTWSSAVGVDETSGGFCAVRS